MAANKRKIQANAQKYLQKGQLDKALKEYQSLVQLDPRDSNSRLKMGDLFLRQGDKDKAADCYIKVAEQFMKDGFDAKAVAIYKQVGKIDPERLDIYEPLAELYQRLGLTAEALSALQTAADAYHKEGRKRDALELLRKMATLDPTNTTSRLKIADLLRQADMEQDALTEYLAVAEELERQAARDELVSVYERILEIEPERVPVLTALTRILTEQGPPERAQPYAERLAAASPDAPDGHDLLAQIYTALGREDAAQECYRTLAEVYRRTGDDDRAREISQRIFGSELADAGQSPLGGDLSDLPADPKAPPPREAMEEALDLGAGDGAFSADAEQLLAEASVYLRYGKTERAVATLETLLATEPDHRVALEKLGEAHVENGDSAKAVAIFVRAAQIARVEEDQESFASLVARIAGLDAAAAEHLGGDAGDPVAPPAEAAAPEPAPAAEPEEPAPEPALDTDDVEIEIDLGGGEPPPLEQDEASDDEVELDLDADFDMEDATDEEPAAPVSAAEETVFQGSPDATVLQSSGGADATIMQMQEDEEPTESGSGESTTTPQQIAEHLEEADFYFEQNLFDEAEALYQKILEAAPQHPQAMVRMGEIAARRGEDPGAAGLEATAPPAMPVPAEAEADESAGEVDLDAHGDDLVGWDDEEIETAGADAAAAHTDSELDFELDVDVEEAPGLGAEEDEAADDEADTASSLAPFAAAEPEAEESEPEAFEPEGAAFDDADDDTETSIEPPPEVPVDAGIELAADAEEAPSFEEPAASEELDEGVEDEEAPDAIEAFDEAEASDDEAEVFEQVEAPEEPLAAEAAEAAAAEETFEEFAAEPEEEDTESGDEASFDLAAELSDVFDADEESGPRSPEDTDDGFDAIFREFKKGVKEQLSDSDFEAHYDLGIAYREMGLLDDAVGEFRTALGSGELKLSALHMLGLCALDQQQPQDAASHFGQALSLQSIPETQQAALRFDLGRALQASGDLTRARAAFQAVADIDPDYQDVGERLAALDDATSPPQPEVESFESFDDLIAEAESVFGEDDEGESDPVDDVDAAGEEAADALGAVEPLSGEEPLLEAVVEVEHPPTMVEAEETQPSGEPLDPEPEPEAEAEPKRRRRKKKISF